MQRNCENHVSIAGVADEINCNYASHFGSARYGKVTGLWWAGHMNYIEDFRTSTKDLPSIFFNYWHRNGSCALRKKIHKQQVRIWWHYAGSLSFFDDTTVQCDPLLLNGLLPMLFYLSFKIVILLSVCTCSNISCRPVSQLPWGLLLNTWLTFILLSILLTWPIQFNQLFMTNESISKHPNNCINSSLYCFFFSFYFL
jgi:hypothetical protein